MGTAYIGVKIYNEIPSNIKIVNSNIFKEFIKSWIVCHQGEMCCKVLDWLK